MSREDVQALERVYAKWRKGSFTTPEIFDPEVEVTWTPKGIDTPGTTKGVEAMGAMLQRWFEALDDVRIEPERFIDLGDQVLVLVVMRARGRGSGIEVSDRYGHLWTLRDGKAIRLEDADPDDAIELLETSHQPVSGQNVEIVRRVWEGFLRRDNAVLALYDPEVELDLTSAGLIYGRYRGLDGVRAFFRDFLATWEDYGSEVGARCATRPECRCACRVPTRASSRSRSHRRRSTPPCGHCATERLFRFRIYPTRAEALGAVGLEQ